MMNNYLLAILALAISLTALAQNSNSLSPKTSILVFGDSISSAYNIEREQGWVHLLQNFLSKQNISAMVTNASISGETTGGGLARIKKQLIKSKPNIVILELGGNDGLRGFDLKATRHNLAQMIKLCHQQGSTVILAGMKIPPNFGRTYTQRFGQIFQELGQDDNVILIPFILEQVATVDSLMQADGIHPNARAQPIIMRNVWNYLSPLVK